MTDAFHGSVPNEKIRADSCNEKLSCGTTKLKIVIIEDNPDDRSLIRRYLIQSVDFRCTIFEAETGTSGVQLCQEIHPDCVILDLYLPDLDGLGVLQQLRDRESEIPFPVVVLTGITDHSSYGQTAIIHGAQDYLSKDWITAESLGRTVVNSIERFQLMRSKRAEQALKHADRRKNEFLATLAHELRNPLAPIQNGLELIRLAQGDPEAIAQAREMMERQLDQMVRLVDDLLDISRVSNNKLELRKQNVLLTRIIDQAVESVRPMIDAANQVIATDLPVEPISLEADFARLAQVFANLLTNASKFTHSHGHIWLTVTRDDETVKISVKDDGIGIPVEKQGQVFDMFSQIGQPVENAQKGLGIGLSLVQSLVEMHNGTVEMKSDGPGSGCEFTVRLPILRNIVVPTTNPEIKDPATTNSLRVLIVDDNRDAVKSLAMVLKLQGHTVETAYDGREAVDAAAMFRPDVVLLDLGLPKINGYEACRQIRDQEWGQNIKIIAVTGWGQEDDRKKTSDADFDRHLVKPVKPAVLLELLAELQKSQR